VLFAFLLIGDFAWSVKERAAVPVAQVLLKQLEASNFFVAIVTGSLPWALSMLLGPIVAVKSDRFRSRWGRRIPFLLLPTPVIVGGLLGLAFTPEAGSALHSLLGSYSPGLRWCKLGWFSAMWVLFEAASVTANAVFGGLIADVVPSSLTGRFYGMFRAISLLAGIVFTYGIVGQADQYFAAIFIGIAAIYGLGFALMCWRVHEGPYPQPKEATSSGFSGMQSYVRECFYHRFYAGLFLAMMLGMAAASPVNTFGLFYAQKAGLGLEGYGKALALTYTCSMLLALPVGWLADRWHPLNVGVGCLFLYAAALLPAGLLVHDSRQFATAFILHGVISGLYMTGTAAMGQYLFPREKFAQFQSATNLFVALGYAVVPPLMGGWLDLSGQDYRDTFIAGSVLALASAVTKLWLIREFKALGGKLKFSPPDMRQAAPSRLNSIDK